MTHDELVLLALKVHAVLLSVSIPVLFKCADSCALFKTSLEQSREIKRRLRQKVFADLSTTLKPLFMQPQDRVIKVLDFWGPDGKGWKETGVDLQETEDYKNAFFDFIRSNVNAMANYRNLEILLDKCKRWASYLSWSLWCLMAVQIISLIVVGVWGKLCGKGIGEQCIVVGLVISIVLVVNCIVPFPFLFHYHGRAAKYEND